MTEAPPPSEEDFDHSDIGTDPGKSQADIDHVALVDLTRRLTALESRVSATEAREAHEERLMRRLRKLLAAWISED